MKNKSNLFSLFLCLGVGIGTSQAQVVDNLSNGANTRTELRVSNSGSILNGFRIGITTGNANGNAGFIRLTENRPLRFYTNDIEHMRLLPNGNLALGGTIATELFDVYGNVRFRGITVGTNSFLTTHDNDGVLHQIAFTGNAGDVLLGDGTFGTAPGTGGDDDWYDVANPGFSPTSINSSIYTFGNVGIGIDSPSEPLNVDLPAGGIIASFDVSGRDALDEAFIFNGGTSGVNTTLTVRGRAAPGIIVAQKDNGQSVRVNSQMSGSNGVGIEPVGATTLYIGGEKILPNQDDVQLGQDGRSFKHFGVSTSFVLQQEISPSAGMFIKLGNRRDDTAPINRRGLVLRPPSLIAPTTGNGTEYENTHYFSVCNNVGGNLPTSKTLFTVGPHGHVGIGLGGTETLPTTPACALEVNGDVCIPAGNAYVGSDRRYKKGIAPLEGALENLMKLSGNRYQMRINEFPNLAFKEGDQLGLIAQEVEEVYPELIMTSSNGFKAVNYDGMIPVLVQAMKEQQEIIDQQNEKIESLQETPINGEIQKLREELEALKEMIASSNGVEVNTIEVWLSENDKSIFLGQNQPNPFSEVTRIPYFLPEQVSNAQIEIYSSSGEKLTSQKLSNGRGMVKVFASDISVGVYSYAIIVDGKIVESKKMVVTK